jgi:hypothetical protein
MKFSSGLEKIALIGPVAEAAGLGIPSAIGYHVGRAAGFREGKEESDKPGATRNILGALLVPGYVGYRMGKRHGHAAAAAKEKEKKK